jgi:dihydroneopterin aldolase
VSDRILLRGLVFEGHVGARDEERERLQPVHVDVALTLDLAAAGRTDDLERTVDYSAAAKLVGRIIATRTHHLIETIAESVAAELMAAFPSVQEIEVRVRKPQIRVGDAGGSATVEVRRRRAGEEASPG